jgi:hypothetical protein
MRPLVSRIQKRLLKIKDQALLNVRQQWLALLGLFHETARIVDRPGMRSAAEVLYRWEYREITKPMAYHLIDDICIDTEDWFEREAIRFWHSRLMPSSRRVVSREIDWMPMHEFMLLLSAVEIRARTEVENGSTPQDETLWQRGWSQHRIYEPLRARSSAMRASIAGPWKRPELDPRWRSSSVIDLAKTIHADFAFEKTPILADALMDSGCDNEIILRHLHDPAPKCRGDWVIELVLQGLQTGRHRFNGSAFTNSSAGALSK